MSKRKGVSAEDKRLRMLEIFHESQDFFQLKELEKIAPKEKGIIAQSVKDVIQNLVDDGLVDTDKIGTSVYFWSYPSKGLKVKKYKLQEINSLTEQTEKKLKIIKELLTKEKAGKEESQHRTAVLEEIKKLECEETKLHKELQLYKDNNPETLNHMKNDIKAVAEAANRWTDNIFAIKNWCKRKFLIDESVLNKQFEIPPEMEYLDL